MQCELEKTYQDKPVRTCYRLLVLSTLAFLALAIHNGDYGSARYKQVNATERQGAQSPIKNILSGDVRFIVLNALVVLCVQGRRNAILYDSTEMCMRKACHTNLRPS
jgi:hypothetical protein